MLEQEVVFVGDATNTTEDWASHELIDVGAESINNL